MTLALAGVAVSALLGAFTSALILLDNETLDAFRFWSVGSLAGRDARIAVEAAPFLLVGVVLALVNAPGLNSSPSARTSHAAWASVWPSPAGLAWSRSRC